MSLPTLIEPTAEGKYRATFGPPFDLEAEGSAALEAEDRLKALLRARLAARAEVVAAPVPAGENPWAGAAGVFRDDPLFDDWQGAIAENRRRADETEGLTAS